MNKLNNVKFFTLIFIKINNFWVRPKNPPSKSTWFFLWKEYWTDFLKIFLLSNVFVVTCLAEFFHWQKINNLWDLKKKFRIFMKDFALQLLIRILLIKIIRKDGSIDTCQIKEVKFFFFVLHEFVHFFIRSNFFSFFLRF